MRPELESNPHIISDRGQNDEGTHFPIAFPLLFYWRRMGRKGQRCRVLVRGGMNSALVEFEDGYRVVTSRNALRSVK